MAGLGAPAPCALPRSVGVNECVLLNVPRAVRCVLSGQCGGQSVRVLCHVVLSVLLTRPVHVLVGGAVQHANLAPPFPTLACLRQLRKLLWARSGTHVVTESNMSPPPTLIRARPPP